MATRRRTRSAFSQHQRQRVYRGPGSSINATTDISTGSTAVSGAQLVSFGGPIDYTGNGGVGVSVSSKAGLDPVGFFADYGAGFAMVIPR